MLDKIFNKKKKQEDVFAIPERKSIPDTKNISKLGPKALQEIVQQQEKYISLLINRIEQIKVQHRRIQQKSQEIHEKNDVINAQISKMTNEHEQLTMKFDNLQNSLQIMITTNQQQLNSQLQFLKNQQIISSWHEQIPKNMNQVFSLFQDRFQLCYKISQQNKFLKQKITDIEVKFQEIQQRYQNVEKQKGYNGMIPQLMQKLQELKRQRKNQTFLPEKTTILEQQMVQHSFEKAQMKQVETMTSEQLISSQNNSESFQKKSSKQSSDDIQESECKQCKDLNIQNETLKQQKMLVLGELKQWNQKYQSLQYDLSRLKEEKSGQLNKKCKQLKSLNLQKISIENECETLKFQNSQLKRSLEDLQMSISQIRNQNQVIILKLEQKIKQLTDKQRQNTSSSMKSVQNKGQQLRKNIQKKISHQIINADEEH